MPPTFAPFEPFLARQPFVVLDGGLATELERRGIDLTNELWSADALLRSPDQVRQVHRDYLDAGADVIATASYQATIPGLLRRGLSTAAAEQVIATSAQLAREAREEFLAATSLGERLAPLVAGSIGPYGAFLSDGSEYRGDYHLSPREFKAFHAPRIEVLVASGVDLLALETIPSRREAAALIDLIEARGDVAAWLSFSVKNDAELSDGTPFEAVVAEFGAARSVVAVGINCADMALIAPLLGRAESAKPYVVYPNAGGVWDPDSMRWSGGVEVPKIEDQVERWHRLGARVIGGCCRTGPATISAIRERMITG